MTDATHREVKKPQITSRYLAEYMAGSERVRRSILRKCKYQSTIPVTQHTDAKIIIANHLRNWKGDRASLEEKIERLSRKICDSEFEAKQLKHNLDYLNRFAAIAENIALPKAELVATRRLEPITLNRTKVNFSPELLISRRTRSNDIRIGAVSFRYSKGDEVEPDVAAFQAAFSFAYLRAYPTEQEAEPERKLCLVVDNYAGRAFEAPTNSIDRFNEMSAACATIADCWDNIDPPAGAILK